jgi:hypothetical protein
MKHIRQINSVGTNSYTIVDLSDYNGVIEEHPTLVVHSDLFEISDDKLPEFYQLVKPSFEVQSVKNMQLRLALIDFGIMPSAVDSAINSMPDGAVKEIFHTLWNYAVLFEINDPKLIQMATALGLTTEQTNALFQLASTK